MTDLTGKIAVVTGGATGIGLGISAVLAERGATVAVIQRNTSHFAEASRLIESVKLHAYQADIANRKQVDEAIQSIASELGRIDILVNNASLTGKPAVAAFLDCSAEQLDAIVDVNLKGTFHVSQAVARVMVQEGIRGSIVNLTSVGGFAAQELASVYCATKAAQISLAKSMALELAPYGIRVNAVAPGDIYTPANAAIVSDLETAGASGKYLRQTPLNRRGTPEEIGRAVAFLASDDASFITGATLVADGGFLTY